MTCKGICYRFKVSGGHGQKYANGLKRCTQCEIWLRQDGNECPCCHAQLRFTPLSAKDKRNYRKTMRISS